MARKTDITNILRRRIVILDGATGTELQKRGLPNGVCPELWCIAHPEAIQTLHKEYQRAGADIIYSCTFGANRIKLAQYGASDVQGINKSLAAHARDALGTTGFVAGDIGPTGRFVEPFGDLDFEEAVDIFREQITGLLDGGVDMLVIETMIDIQEARAALIAARELTDCFVMTTMTFEENGRTLNGTDPVSALVTLQSLGADAVGCNCSTGPAEMRTLVKTMKPFATVPLVAKPNAGMPELQGNETIFSMTPGEFGKYGREFADLGVNLMGGCCGTAPGHIRSLKKALEGKKPARARLNALGAVSSPRHTVFIERGGTLKIIGERINPTGKKDLQEELRNTQTGRIGAMGRQQEQKGADLLDVNVGAPGVDQRVMMKEAIKTLSVAATAPLVIDSADPGAIEEGLRIYPGRALINSISGEKGKLEKLLPLAARYGAMFILLPLTEKGVPETAEERKTVIREVYRKAQEFGFHKADIVVDGLVMTVSADSKAPRETLKTIEWADRSFRCATLLGLSNVSFGMPARPWLNAAFLGMAAARGLAMAIANPEVEEIMHIKVAGDLLNGKDRDGAIYLAHFSTGSQEKKTGPGNGALLTPGEKIVHTIIDGNRDEIEGALATALKAGEKPQDLVNSYMISAITEVGNRYDRKEYFLPQLIAGAETMKKGVAYLEPLLKENRQASTHRGTIVMATVEGDVHDIGKNIVVLMLKNQGYDIVDLGKDVPAARIIEEAKRSKAALIGLSALMTTTMVTMETTIVLARQQNLTCDFMVGGAVVTPSYASSIGAHYAKDSVDAVRLAEHLTAKTPSK